jgi:hypothetical protein
MCPLKVASKWSPVIGTWPLHTRPSVVIQTLWPSAPVNATTDEVWPVEVETMLPFQTPGVVAAVVAGGALGPAPDVVLESPPPPPPQAVNPRLAAMSVNAGRREALKSFISFSEEYANAVYWYIGEIPAVETARKRSPPGSTYFAASLAMLRCSAASAR